MATTRGGGDRSPRLGARRLRVLRVRAREGASNDARTKALLSLARRVVRTGGGGAAAEIARAKEVGLSDAEILETLARVAGKIFTNAAALVAQTEIDFRKPDRLPNP